MPGMHLETTTYQTLLQAALSYVPNELDKRQGSIIYDAISPACYLLADFYMQLRNMYIDTFAATATGEALDLRAGEHGVTRIPASAAVKIGVFEDENGDPIPIPLGSRFTIVSEEIALRYYAYDVYSENGSPVPGSYLMRCETAGTVGNSYTGELSSINYIYNLATAELTSIYLAGEDAETDEALRTRLFYLLKRPPFAGNVSAYYLMISALQDIGAVQVYPTWNGGGTVKCCILDSAYQVADQTLIDYVKGLVDPTAYEGNGWGLAPIGHTVTITTPDEVTVDLEFTIELANGFTMQQVEEPIQEAISTYLISLRTTWGTPIAQDEYYCNVYRSQIMVAILSVTGVVNVTLLTINTADADLILTEDGTTQEIPVLGDVTINDGTPS